MRKHIYINVTIFGEGNGSVLRMDEASRGQEGVRGPMAVIAQTQVTVGNLRLRVTHKSQRSRQEAAAEYFLFLPPCRRQTGATLGIKGGEVWKRRAKHSSADPETC